MTVPRPPEQAADAFALDRRFKGVTIGLVSAYLLLALTHGGEFWPFSRFGMFATPARPWLRATLRELSAEQIVQPLREVGVKELAGQPFALGSLGIDQNDLSEMLRKLKEPLEGPQLALIARYFKDVRDRNLVLYTVRGSLRSADRSLRVRYRPLALITPGGVRAAEVAEAPDAGGPP
jgi:tetrahydromethanopterin S-methyltransferase subunit F